MTRVGLPHSDIAGSMLASSSPALFAANHVLLRPLTPRHPPCTLHTFYLLLWIATVPLLEYAPASPLRNTCLRCLRFPCYLDRLLPYYALVNVPRTPILRSSRAPSSIAGFALVSL